MDPKVCDKLLTTHWRGYGVAVEALRDRSPLRRSSGKGPKMGSHSTEGCGGGIRFSWMLLLVWGYVGIYRMKKYVGGATWAPRGWRARPPSRGPLGRPLTYFFLLYIPTYPQMIKNGAKTLIPPPQLSVSTRSHLGACSGAPLEGASITEGFYINTIASLVMCE